MSNAVITRLLEQRSEQETFIDQLLANVEQRGSDLVDAERANLNAARERIAEIDEQLEPLEAFEAARSAHAAGRPSPVTPTAPAGTERQSLTVTERTHQYRTAGEFMVDKIRAAGFPQADLLPDPEAQARVASALQTRAVASTTTAQTTGVLPESILGPIVNDLDAARPFIASVGAKDFTGAQGKVFHRPIITQHVTVSAQSAELAELASQQFTIGDIDFTKKTFGGALKVSRQDIDWTSPSAWDALLADFMDVYGVQTEDYYSDYFADNVSQSVTYDDEATGDAKFDALLTALYAAASKAATANGTKRASSKRLPNHVWASVDMWETLGAAIDRKNRLAAASKDAPGDSSITSFAGSILDVPRTVAPGMAAGSLIVGRTTGFEFYEERLGFLQAVSPSTLGIEVAYGGYASGEFIDATQFCKIVGDA